MLTTRSKQRFTESAFSKAYYEQLPKNIQKFVTRVQIRGGDPRLAASHVLDLLIEFNDQQAEFDDLIQGLFTVDLTSDINNIVMRHFDNLPSYIVDTLRKFGWEKGFIRPVNKTDLIDALFRSNESQKTIRPKLSQDPVLDELCQGIVTMFGEGTFSEDLLETFFYTLRVQTQEIKIFMDNVREVYDEIIYRAKRMLGKGHKMAYLFERQYSDLNPDDKTLRKVVLSRLLEEGMVVKYSSVRLLRF